MSGPWSQRGPHACSAMDDVAKKLAKTGVVDMLDGGPKAQSEAVARRTACRRSTRARCRPS